MKWEMKQVRMREHLRVQREVDNRLFSRPACCYLVCPMAKAENIQGRCLRRRQRQRIY